MDELSLNIIDRQNDDYQLKSVTIQINGKDIIEILKDYEMPFAKREGSKNIAGAYSGLSPDVLLKYLTNPEAYDVDEHGRVAILECECGSESCWPMKTKINEAGDKIIWSDFEQPHRSKDRSDFWDYTNFGQFEFDKTAYLKQINKLKNTADSNLKLPE